MMPLAPSIDSSKIVLMNKNKNHSNDNNNEREKNDCDKSGNKNRVANSSNYSRKYKQASIANYDPPHCPALNRLKKRGKEIENHLSSFFRPKPL